MKMYVYISVILIMLSQAMPSYLLFTPYTSDLPEKTTYLIDGNENIINTWTHERGPASMPYLLQDSSLIYPYVVDNPTMVAGGTGGGIQKLSWDGAVQWDYTFSNETYQHHHDVEPLANGNVLILVWERMSAESAFALGRTEIENPINQMWSSAILELEPETGDIVWEWHLWDHLIQDTDPSLPGYGNIPDHPELFDINCGPVGSSAGGPGVPNADWMHMNSIHHNPALDQIVLSSRLQNEIYIIDHSTTTEEAAGHVGGSYGKGGDFLYRWGNPQNYGRGSSSDKILSAQHSVNWVDEGFVGSGNIVLFNNFHSSSGSAVLEFETPMNSDGTYTISDDAPYGPMVYDWSYELDIIVPMQGGAFRNEDGNTIVTQTHLSKIQEIDYSGNVIWEYVYESDGVSSSWIARANSYKSNYLGTSISGDLNDDGITNILDIVIAINLVIEGQNDSNADINGDGTVNILDIVQLVNIIIG